RGARRRRGRRRRRPQTRRRGGARSVPPEEPARARELARQVGDRLRALIHDVGADEVLLPRELANVARRTRRARRLELDRVAAEVDRDGGPALVPATEDGGELSVGRDLVPAAEAEVERQLPGL